MSVLVKGMSIPDNCESCRFATGFGFCLAKSDIFCGYTDDSKRPEWCSLVEVPVPHGRLIEAPDVSEYEVYDEDTGTKEISLFGLMECHRMVKDAKTIIETEGE